MADTNKKPGVRFSLASSVLSFMFLMAAAGATAQELHVANVAFKEVDEKIILTYDLEAPPKKQYFISVALSYDFGETYTMHPLALQGDVGNGVKTGLQKTIVWDYRRDYPDGLTGDGFVFAVQVEPYKKSKWLAYTVAGTGLAGGLVWYYYHQYMQDDNKNSILTITVPADI
ncbi:hypothetical protein JXO52_08025 [bacterium]|nr:hypothetical protein [bacterium]